MSYRSIYRQDLFAGMVVLVTGGGSGIGRCVAHELASLGATVALAGRRMERLEATAAEIAEDGGKAICHACDLRVEDAVKEMIADIVARAGRLDGVVNNAGGQFTSPAADMSTKGYETVLRNNQVAQFTVAREAFNQWMKDHGGAIVNISADPIGGMPAMVHSAGARAGLIAVSDTLAYEWAANGVRVNTVVPGYIASSGMNAYTPEMQAKFAAGVKKMPLKRMGTEAEVSSVICFLLSEGASYVTGACYYVHGASSSIRQDWDIPDHTNAKPYQGFHRYNGPSAFLGDYGKDGSGEDQA
ncbi:MAG: SDR family oxidoreductase [Minwuia sp.]|uniref:SDR family oxidoreductase n=1 Tax=Minwuia sp. TaxID=2493630 RepID=UPI003A8C24E2